jgi:hypothetical protein
MKKFQKPKYDVSTKFLLLYTALYVKMTFKLALPVHKVLNSTKERRNTLQVWQRRNNMSKVQKTTLYSHSFKGKTSQKWCHQQKNFICFLKNSFSGPTYPFLAEGEVTPDALKIFTYPM